MVLKKYEKRKGEKNIEETERNLETKYQEFIRTLKEAVKEISERREGKKDKNKTVERFERDRQPKKLWDQECDEVIKQRKRALQEFRKTKTVLSFIEYKKRRAVAIKVINTEKREIFDQFCSTINRFTNLIYVWNMRILQNMRKNINWNTWAQKIEMKKSRKR